MLVAPLSSLQKILAALILLVIVFFSLFRITESPPFGTDEGWVVQIASNISHFGIDGLQFSPGNIEHVSVLTSVGYPLIYPLAFWFKLFGIGILQARLMMVFYMLGFVFVSFIFLRRMYGNAIALGSLAILATFPPFYTFGKEVIGEVPVLFFLILFLLFFNLATSNSKKKRFWLTMAGFSAGLCMASKTMALAFIPVLFVGAILVWRRGLASWKDIGVVAVSAVIPIAVWLVVNFQSGDSLSSVANYYFNPSALTDRTATFWLNLRKLFTNVGSLFMLSLIAVWIVGVIARLKTKTKIPLEEWIALIFSMVIIFSLLFRYYDARYLFPVQVLAILFFPYSLYSLLQKTRIYLLGIVVLSVLGLYQLSFRSYIADSYGSTTTADLSNYFSLIPSSASIFFYNTTNAVPFFSGSNYYQRITMFKKWVLGSEYAPIVREGRVDLLVLGPPMLEADAMLPLDKYAEVAKFREIRILKRKVRM